jgi:hypothetical protein
MRYLSLGEVVDLHQTLFDQTGGAVAVVGCISAPDLVTEPIR